MQNKTEKVRIKKSAIKLLSYREHSFFELKTKLYKKGFDPRDIEEVLLELIKLGYLSEERFVESYVRSRINKNFGPARILSELIDRGIDFNSANSYLKTINWFPLAKVALEKKFISNNKENRLKQMRYLGYKGFYKDDILKIFKEE